jgi:hypothetical protein
MAILLVIGVMPEGGSVTVDAAESASAIANETIKDILGYGDYVPQITRTRMRSSTKPNDTYLYNGGFYYSTKSTNLYDEIKKEYYSGAGGICTWCAFTNLLNRKIALDGGTKAVFEANKYDILNVAKRIGNTDEGVRFSVSGQNDYIWIGNKREFADVYNKSFDNGKGRSYTGYTEVKVNNVRLDSTRNLKDDTLTKRINEIKEKLKNELDAHPEGIVIQFSNDVGMHGIVLTGYYYTNGYLSFYTVDTGGSNYGDGFTALEDSYLGTNYGNKSFQGVKRIDNIVKYITSYVYIQSASGNLSTPGPVEINHLSINGQTSSICLNEGDRANLTGTVISSANITSVSALITKEGRVFYNTPIAPNVQTVDLIESALNKGDGCITFGTLEPGTYELTLTAMDSNGKTDTKKITFTINGQSVAVNPVRISGLSLKEDSTFTEGNSRNLMGTVTSGSDITYVSAVVTNTAGFRKEYGPITPSQQATVNSKCIDLYSSALNSSFGGKYNMLIRFGDFGPGDYTLTVTAKDVRNTEDSKQIKFTVTSSQNANEIKIDLSKFASSLPYNNPYNIQGMITAGSEILQVQGTIYNILNPLFPAKYRDGFKKSGRLDCTETQSSYIARNKLNSSLMANKTTFNIINSNINSSFSMAGLAKGIYTFRVKVTLVNGTTKTASVGFCIR